LDWFHRHFGKALSQVRDKYDPSLHTETDVDKCLHSILGDVEALQSLDERLLSLTETYEALEKAARNLRRSSIDSDIWRASLERLDGQLTPLIAGLGHVLGQLRHARDRLRVGDVEAVRQLKWDDLWAAIRAYLTAYLNDDIVRDPAPLLPETRDDAGSSTYTFTSELLRTPSDLASRLFSEALHCVDELARLGTTELHILGGAGYGKTSFACHSCLTRLNAGLPALLVLGIHFTTNQVLIEQLRTILDIPPAYTVGEFLQALSTAAQVYGTRLPIIIDGLNEATVNGRFSDVWQRDLAGFAHDISRTQDLVLVTTCRDAYRALIWPKGIPVNALYAHGFASDELETAVARYFGAYKIVADITAASLEQFSHPIYLRIFCESVNPDRRAEKAIYIGEHTLFDVFAKYLDECSRRINTRLRRRPTPQFVNDALHRLAEALWVRHERSLPINDAIELIDRMPPDDIEDWTRSLTQAVESEGLLVIRNLVKNVEDMSFTYDLLAGYLIADYLVEQARADPVAYFNQSSTLAALFGEDPAARHPLHEDIGRCVAALLPTRMRRYLHDIVPCEINQTASNYSIRALFEIPPASISRECGAFITRLFQLPMNRRPFLDLARTTIGHPEHPLNINFWHAQLLSLSMQERDVSWTECIRYRARALESDVLRFEALCKDGAMPDAIAEQRLHLLARHTIWLLTSTVRVLRDTATQALYWYGRRWPSEFLALLTDGLSINDPYVPERVLAAAYGIAMALRDAPTEAVPGILQSLARRLYDALFAPGVPHATTHILARDYARHAIEIAVYRHPDVLTSEELRRIAPPFADGGIRTWRWSADRDASRYRGGNDPIGDDFARYTVDRLAASMGDPEPTPLLDQIRWRMYDLGYAFDMFGEIDRSLVNANWNLEQGDRRKVERYGKKYAWIAFYELAGFRQDQGALDLGHYPNGRISDVDIDPSFPELPHDVEIVCNDIAADDGPTLDKWITDGADMQVGPLLIVDELLGERGPWVLLHGYVNQEDETTGRSRFCFMRGLIARIEDTPDLRRRLESGTSMRDEVRDIPEDYYTYAGEIPWCETYPLNGWMELHQEDWVVSTSLPTSVPRWQGEESSSDQSEAASIETVAGANVCDVAAEALLLETGMMTEIDSTQDIAVGDGSTTRTIEVLPVARSNNWESYHSPIIAGRSVATPAREIAEHCGLTVRPQTFDWYDSAGRRATIITGHDVPWHTRQAFTYIRQDLLDSYLRAIASDLIWCAWGERLSMSRSEDETIGDAKTVPMPTSFMSIAIYSDLSDTGEEGTA